MNSNRDLAGNLRLGAAEQSLMDQPPESYREARLAVLSDELAQLQPSDEALLSHTSLQAAELMLESAGLLLDLDKKELAWEQARPCVECFIAHTRFEDAALACQYVYLSDQPDAIAAIGQAAWLAVTYPINPNLTVNVLDLVINEMPDHSDGAAVAAAAAHYVVDVRCTADEYRELRLFTGSMLARVARHHSNVDTQPLFELWVERMELDYPEKFLVRLRNVVDVMVQDDWWFDREALLSDISD